MKVFITGGTGFFGKSLMDAGFPDDLECVFLSRDPERFKIANPQFSHFRFIRGDVRNFTFPHEDFDWIIHGATTASPLIPDEETISVTLEGTRRILLFAKHCHAQKMLYISSGAVYGIQPPGLYGIPETFPAAPVTAYGKAKFRAEQLCLDSSIPTVIARGFAFLGKYLPRNAHFAAGNFLDAVLHDHPIEIHSDGRPYRSYLDAADLVEWLWTLLRKAPCGEAFNIGAAQEISISSLAQTILRISGKDLPIRITGKNTSGPAPRYVPDTTKIQLFCREKVTLEESIRRILLNPGNEADGISPAADRNIAGKRS